MMYRIIDIDIADDFSPVTTDDEVQGIAFVVRKRSRPIGFFMVPVPPNAKLQVEDIRTLVEKHVRADLMKDTPRKNSGDRNSETASLKVTVAICTKDHPEDLAACLKHLRRCRSSEPRGRFDILVVDNAPSSSATRDLVSTIPDVRYTVERRPGLNFARNRAVSETRGDILAFVDDDVIVDRFWYGGLRRALEEHPDAGAITGLVLPAELNTRAQILFEANGGFEKSFEPIRYGQTLPGHPFYPCLGGKFGTGCNMAFRHEVLVQLGGFDEALDTGATLPGGGDTDMLYRVVRAGHPLIYQPEFMLFHRHRKEYRQLRTQLRKSWGEGLMAFVAKTYTRDPSQRGNLRRLTRWWFAHYIKQFFVSLAGRHPLPPDILAAQLWGGLVGILVAYPRSLKRTESIRRQYS